MVESSWGVISICEDKTGGYMISVANLAGQWLLG